MTPLQRVGQAESPWFCPTADFPVRWCYFETEYKERNVEASVMFQWTINASGQFFVSCFALNSPSFVLQKIVVFLSTQLWLWKRLYLHAREIFLVMPNVKTFFSSSTRGTRHYIMILTGVGKTCRGQESSKLCFAGLCILFRLNAHTCIWRFLVSARRDVRPFLVLVCHIL